MNEREFEPSKLGCHEVDITRADDSVIEVTLEVTYLPESSDPDDGPEYEIIHAQDALTGVSVELTESEQIEAFEALMRDGI